MTGRHPEAQSRNSGALLRIGTAGWNIPKPHAAAFPAEGSHLERYAAVFRAVEINSSFYRPHRPATYARWASAVPEDFRFAVKMPKAITHENRLDNVTPILERFLAEIAELGEKLGPILIQLPPSLKFHRNTATAFFGEFRNRSAALACCEPRHASWFTDEADAMLTEYRVARVAADPPPIPQATRCGGWMSLRYRRLHGSPRIYYSAYDAEVLTAVAEEIGADLTAGIESWCILDNTAAFAATGDALTLQRLFKDQRVKSWSG